MAIANWTCVSWVAYAPGTIAVYVTWIEREFNACQTPRSTYTSIFNRLRAIARYWSEIATFPTHLAFYAPVRSGPWDNRGKCHRIGKRIQCLSNASQHVPIYLQPFLRYSELLVENCDIFRPHFCLAAPLEFREDLDKHKTRMNGLSCGEENMTIMFSRFDTIPACDRQTDGRTDGRPVYS